MSILVDVVRIANFRSLRNVEVRLSHLTLLVGSNNSGKTTFLKALNLALGTERRFISKEDLFIGGDGDDEHILIDLRIVPVDESFQRVTEFGDLWRDVEFGELINLDGNDKQYVSFRTKIAFNALKNDFEIKKYKIPEWREGAAGWEEIEYEDPLRTVFTGIPLFLIDAQRDILADLRDRSSYLGKLVSKIKIDDEKISDLETKIKELNEEIVGSSEVLSHLKEKLKELSGTIQAAGETSVDITPLNKKIRDLNKGLNINFQEGENESFPLEYHGMGTRSWASLLTFKAYISWLCENFARENVSPYHPVLALEEPESHLHPNAQRHIYNQLAAIKGQKIISSHSPYLAGQCALEEIRHFYKSDNGPIISRFELSGLEDEDIRKLRREIMHSKGELLFARAIVLFEGETEEQALPIFAKSFWGKYPFELGINFVGVGGSGKYLPFLRFAKTFNIPWYIFSDGEPQTINAVRSALEKIEVDLGTSPENVIIIPNDKDFEQILIDLGYQREIKDSFIASVQSQYDKTEFTSEQDKAAKTAVLNARIEEINNYDNQVLLKEMDKKKTSISPIFSTKISSLEDKNRRFPTPLKSLLDRVTAGLKLKIDERNV